MKTDLPTVYAEDLIIPEVIASFVDQKLVNNIKFSPFATVDTTLVGVAGDTIKFPSYTYIGDAVDVPEGEAIPYSNLTASTVETTVKKAGRGVDITDEAVLKSTGDVNQEIGKQLGLSIASKVDNDVIVALQGIIAGMTLDKSGSEIDSDIIADALVKFGEDDNGLNTMFIHPSQLNTFRKATDWIPYSAMRAEELTSGSQGSIYGVNFVLSNKVPYSKVKNAFENFIIKDGALKIVLKRDTLVEKDRDITYKTTKVNLDKHYVAYLYDSSKAIKVWCKASPAYSKIS